MMLRVLKGANSSSRALLLVLALPLFAACAASGSGGDGTGTGGSTPGSGGATNTGGGPGTGSGGSTSGSGGSGASGGATGSGGTAGASGSTGQGGTAGSSGAADGGGVRDGAATDGPTVGTAQALSCGTGINIPATNVISDFRGSLGVYKTATRGGSSWYTYGPTPTDPSNPVFALDTANSGPCSSGGSLRATSPGNGGTGANNWGVGLGLNFKPDLVVGRTKDIYNARAENYTGVGLFMKCSAEVQFVLFKFPDGNSDSLVATPKCLDGGGALPTCNQYGIKNNAITTDWNYYKVYFSETLPDPSLATPTATAVDATTLTGFQIQVNSIYPPGNEANKSANPFTCWVDDVHFLTDTAPTPPAPAACTSADAAPGGFTTSGATIRDCGGATFALHGIARPSFEWDKAGFNITKEDIHRIKLWGANSIRFSISQEFWLASPIYQSYVDRAIRWTLAEGMYPIIDLHWLTAAAGVTGSTIPDAGSSTFWQQVATKYRGDGRVIFELFNEPHVGDVGTWRTGMQGLYTAVRSAGAKNLVLAGGNDFSYDLSFLTTAANRLTPPTGTPINLAYVTHPYNFKGPNTDAERASRFGFLVTGGIAPVVATELGTAGGNGIVGGATSPTDCHTDYYSAVLTYLKANGMSWTAWAWHVDPVQGCEFPTLINNYAGTPNGAGTVVKSYYP